MALTKRFIPHSVNIDTAGGADLWINQIQGLELDQGVALFEESAGSETDREYVAVRDVAPTIQIPTTDLSVLSTIGMSGLHITPGSGAPGLTAFGRELPIGALPTALATSAHLKMLVAYGLIVPLNVQASHNQPAKLQLMLHAYSGAGAAPMVFSSSEAIISGAAGVTKLYTAGAVKINSRLIEGIMSQSVNFGLMVFKESTSGEVYVGYTSIIGREPKIEFSTRDNDLASEVGDNLELSSFGCYFRAVDQNGQRIAPATTSHISIVGTDGTINPGVQSLQHKQAGMANFTITPAKGSGLLTISTSAAIPTS